MWDKAAVEEDEQQKAEDLGSDSTRWAGEEDRMAFLWLEEWIEHVQCNRLPHRIRFRSNDVDHTDVTCVSRDALKYSIASDSLLISKRDYLAIILSSK